MARDVYSLRIFAHASLTSGAGTVGPTVPAGLVYVVRDIDVVRSTTGASEQLDFFNPLGGVLWNVVPGVLDAGANGHWRGRQIFSEGEQVGVRAFSGTWAVMVSGYQLTLP